MLARVKKMYEAVSRAILVNGKTTDWYDVEAGVPQGAVLSPLLYAVYIDGLHKALQEKGLGVRIFGQLVPLLMYADDIVLLAKDATETHRIHAVVQTKHESVASTKTTANQTWLCSALVRRERQPKTSPGHSATIR